jgi:4-amino-4-deoxy-L-arabinose transferase-like glycosyltransferase
VNVATAVDRRSRFGLLLASIFVAALTWRVIFVLIWGLDPLPFGDGLQYHFAGTNLANGGGFANSVLVYFGGVVRPSAQHPPMYAITLAYVTRSGRALGLGSFDSTTVHQIASAVFSSVGVVVIGLLGRRVAGARVGIVAALFAAAYPALWIPDAVVMSESLVVLTTALFLLAAVAYIDKPGVARTVAFGITAGLAMLTRSEVTFLLLVVAAGMIAMRHVVGRGIRARHMVLTIAVAAVVVSPWVVRNLTTFDRPVFLSENVDSVIGGANCANTYAAGRRLGTWDASCNTQNLPQGDESVLGAELRHRGVQYARHHLNRVPVVAVARVGRLLSLYRPLDNDLGGPRWALRMNVATYYALMVAAVFGALRLRANRRPLWLFVAVLGTTVAVAAVTYGSSRFRIDWDIALVVLAAAAFTRRTNAKAN